MIYIVCYDIKFDAVCDSHATKRLNEVSKILGNYGIRRQRSLFECILDQKMLESLKKELEHVIDSKKDSVRIYPLCTKCLNKTKVQGVGEIIKIREYEIV